MKNILVVDMLGRDAKSRVAESLFNRLIAKYEVVTNSGYFDTYDELCAGEEAMGGVFIGSVSNNESTDVYYKFNDCVSIVRCLTGYKNGDMCADVLSVHVPNLISAIK